MSNGAGAGRFMARGLGQVLFNYLPDATLDYDRGSCICKVAEVRVTTIEGIDPRHILNEIRSYVSRWEDRIRGFPDTRRAELFLFGTPDEVIFNVYPLVFECRICRAAVSFPNERQFLSRTANRSCRWCGGRLIQIYHVLVHECGNLKSLWVPTCPRHGTNPSRVFLDFRSSQKARDFRWVCKDCGSELRPINRPCDWCSPSRESDERNSEEPAGTSPMMRAIPHRANAAYYAHHITLVNVDTQDVAELLVHPDRERLLVDAYLRDSYATQELLEGIRTERDPDLARADQLRQRAAELPEGPGRTRLLEAAETLEALAHDRMVEGPREQETHTIGQEAFKELFEYVKLRGTCRLSGIREARETAERVRPGRGVIFDQVEMAYRDAKISEVKLVSDFPILTAVFGYTRVGFDPESTLGDSEVRTTFNAFPTLRMSREAFLDRVPVFVNRAETEGLFVRLDPLQIVEWLGRRLPGSVAEVPKTEMEARLWLLQNVGTVDRFVTVTGMATITRAVFGLIHTLSHLFIRSAALLGGVDRTGLGEYLFPRIGGFVVFNSNTVFNLGGLTTLFEENLLELIETTTSHPLARECVYDPVCSEHWNGSCHACTHLGEMACSFFNRGMSRSFVFGGIGQSGFWNS
jgi:hypothetical protein